MADSPISGLPAVTLPLAGTEETPVVQGGITKKATAAELLAGAATAAQGVKADTALQPGGPLATPSSGTLTSCTGLPLTTGVTGLLPVASGGTGTATPALVQGTNVTITGTWPNQTINAAGGGGGGATNLSLGAQTTTTFEILSDTGTDVTIPAATALLAGGLSAADKIKLNATSGTNTGDNSPNSLYSGLVSNATHTGDATGSVALTLATVNANVGSFGSATAVGTFTVNAKGLTTAAGSVTITPAIGSVTGLGTGVAAALAVNTGSAGSPVLLNGAGGTPSSITLTSATGLPLTTGVTGLLPVASGGTGTATPSLVSGTNVTVSGTWPNQTISATAGGGGVSAVTGTAPIVSSGGGTPAISITPASGSAPGSMSSADFTKLAGVAPGATANLGTVTNTTGTAPIQVATGTTTPVISITAATTAAAGSMSGADKTKLDGVATGATANSTDAQLRDRSTHTGTQTAATISDFPASSRAQTEAMLTAGTNVTLTPSGTGATRSIQISATAGGGGVSTVTATAPITSTGGGSPDIGIVPASGTVPGSMSSANFTKLAGIATGATANATDAQLRDRATHTGTQAWSTLTATPTTLTGYGITDAASSTHVHGSITNAGAIGTTANLPIITATGGALTVGSFGTTSATFCQGNDARLSDARTPTAHNQAWSTITATPTTRAGYGITDAAANGDIGSTGITLSGPGLAGRSTAGAGSAGLITLGTNLSFAGNVLNAAGGGGTPGGVTTQVQFNNGGVFDGASGLIIDTPSKRIARATFINAVTPAAPADGFTLYALNGTGALSWIGVNGFTRTFDATGITANRTWTPPDRSGAVALDDFLHGTITQASPTNLDVTALAGSIRTITLTGGLTFTASNLAVGKTFGIRLIAGAANRTLAWPSGWVVGLGSAGLPTTLAANKTARFTVECYGSTAADVVVGYAVQP